MKQHLPDLPQLLDSLNPHASLVQRHLWLISLLQWVRGQGEDTQAAVARVRLLLDAVQLRPEWQAQWQLWWRRFMDAVDATALLADHGFAPHNAFMSELGNRLRKKLLPRTPETTDLAELFELLLPSPFDAEWLRALDSDTLLRVQTLLFTPPAPSAPTEAPTSLGQRLWLDALTYSVGQVSATGFASEIRQRMSEQAQHDRPFHELPAHFERLRQAVLSEGPRSQTALDAADVLRQQLDACRRAAQTVYTHLEEHGISVGIVFRLRQLRERVRRIRELLSCLQSSTPTEDTTRLLARLVLVSQEGRSVRALIAASSQLTAAKVAERSAESGEHYITRDAAEYREMLRTAAGGGLVLAFTTWAKFSIYALGLSAFWGGLASGLSYALSFVIVMLLHWTVATKQPAVTAPAMAAKLKDMSAPDSVDNFVDEVAHLLRSQIAAIIGNLGLVIPAVLLICATLHAAGLRPMVDEAHARHTLHDLSLLGPTALFAAFTGVLLFASSIIAGWVENWFVLQRLDSALSYNPRFTQWLGAARAQRWGQWLRRNVSGLAANISLGLMLGLVPAFAGFFGLGLEVRHVTLSTGQVSAAAATLGWAALGSADFWWAVAGLMAIGPLNLAVSFYLAFRLALRAQSVGGLERQRIRQAIWTRLRQAPASFFMPR
ncbi:site-specific recombinase [Curvibacter sp. RS43]|jgi:site-specific recombinase|uniref:site-specific recombinase n=1 Tax=Curvibacter microcysteis TaxID=3026419 RepID=UPI0023619720|nr:site-specific recombinase [Curvibacter sp. RS43]MDD0812449.1 site-specific recombinase [Curvibacter sp. RS43]